MDRQTLPQSYQKLFTDLLHAYEVKQLTKGRKLADQILKKYPSHGETMCMKGLIMVHLGEREAGKALAREGMRNNVSSHICWHVWALLQKGEHNYEEALKSYMVSLKIEKDNHNIIREAATLQIHLRQYDAAVESRLQLLRLRPDLRTQWLGLALTYKLANNLPEAKHVLEHIEGFLRNIPRRDPEYTEYIFFYIRVLADLGELEEALSLLDKKTEDGYLVDRQAIVECRARLLSKLKSAAEADSAKEKEWTEAAEKSWRELIDANCDCYEYYKGFLANAGINLADMTDDSRTEALAILEEFSEKLPKATAPRRLALTISQGEKFRELAKPYVERALQKGIPSLFSDVKNLYTDPGKLQVIEKIVEDFRESASPKPLPESQEPTDYLWTLYFLAQHYSFLGQQEKALEILSTAIEHSPTLPELYMAKARVLKRAGDPYAAVLAMDESRKLDGQDRFLNTKSGKYRLRAGLVTEVDSIFGLFTKKDMVPAIDLFEMQTWHYFRELGDAYRQLGKYNLALKAYYNLQKIFTIYCEEQYDFHTYSLRRSALVSYLDLLHWEDNLHSHPAYIHAALWAARIWIQLYDHPELVKSLQPPEPPQELSKKELNKAKKKAARQATAETSHSTEDTNSSKARSKKNEDKGLEPLPPKDDDPEGLKLIASADPLENARIFLGTMEDFGKDDVEVNATVFDVAIRQHKYMKALQALRRAHARDPEHPEVHVRIAQFAKAVDPYYDSALEVVKSLIQEVLAVMKPPEVSLEAFNSQYLQRNSASSLAILSSAKVSLSLGSPIEEIENLLFTTLGENVQLRINEALEILKYLQQIGAPRAEEFRIACDQKYVLSKVFKSEEEQAVLRQQCVDSKDERELETVF